MTKKITKNSSVILHNNLAESNMNFTEQEQNIIYYCLAHVNAKEDKEFYKFKVPLKSFLEIQGSSKRIYQEIKDICDKLQSHKFKVQDICSTNKEPTFESYVLVTTFKYQQGRGYIEVFFNPELRDFLLDLSKHYTKFKLGNIFDIKGKYTKRIYILLKQYYPKIPVRTLELDFLRERLNIKYDAWHDIRRFVILPAQKEINAKTDICFDFEPIKNGRKVESVKFIIYSNKGTSPKNIPGNRPKTKEELQKEKEINFEHTWKALKESQKNIYMDAAKEINKEKRLDSLKSILMELAGKDGLI